MRGLVAERGLRVDHVSVWRFVHAHGLTHKKKTVEASERDRPDIPWRWAQWLRYQWRIDPKRLVFIDKTWTKTNMAPLRGWAPTGQRLPGRVPYGHWNTMTFLAALRHDRIEAPWLLDGAIDQASFHAHVEHVLAPTLGPGDLVLADNLAYHMRPAVCQAIRRTGARRRRERKMQRFKSARRAQRFLSTQSRLHTASSSAATA